MRKTKHFTTEWKWIPSARCSQGYRPEPYGGHDLQQLAGHGPNSHKSTILTSF